MPILFGQEVSPDVLELNRHLEAAPAKAKTQRKAVTLWKNEREFQAAVFKAAAWEAINQPAYKLLFHVPNEGAHKQPGVRGGVPDLFLAAPRGGHGGLFIELKVGDNKPSQKQLDTISDLRAAGYACAVVWDSVDEVMRVIEEYLQKC